MYDPAIDQDRCQRKRHYPYHQKAHAKADAKSMRFHYGESYHVYWCRECNGGWVIGSYDPLDAIWTGGRKGGRR